MSESGLPPDANLFDVVARWVLLLLSPTAHPHDRGAAARRLAALSPDTLRRLNENPDWRCLVGYLRNEDPAEPLPGDGPWSHSTPAAENGSAASAPGDSAVVPPAASGEGRPVTGPLNPGVWCDFAPDRRRLIAEGSGSDYVQTRIACTIDSSRETIIAACASATVGPLKLEEGGMRALLWATPLPAFTVLNVDRYYAGRYDLLAPLWAAIVEDRAAARGLPRALAQGVLRAVGRDGSPWQWFAEAWGAVQELCDRGLHEELPLEGMATLHLAARAEVARRARDAEMLHPHLLAVTSLAATCVLTQCAGELDLFKAWEMGEGDPVRATEALRETDQSGQTYLERAVHATNLPPSAGAWQALSAYDRSALLMVGQRIAQIPHIREHGVLAGL